MQRFDELAETAVCSEALDAAAVKCAEPPRRSRLPAGPHRSITILKERVDTQSGELRVAGEVAAVPTRKPFSSANPKTAVARGEQASNVAAGQMLTGRRLPRDVPDAIESKQAEFRAQPKIPVLASGQLRRSYLRQSPRGLSTPCARTD